MSNSQHKALKVAFISVFAFLVILYSTRLRADSGVCGGQTINLPFTDVAGNLFFCQIAEAYLSGLTYGTDATHYSPSEVVPRGQMAAFITRTQDSILRRGSLRAALNMWATPKTVGSGAITGVGCFPTDVASDGVDLWVANPQHNGFCGVGTVSRIRASDGRGIETWTNADGAQGVCVARGRIWVTGCTETVNGSLYRIDPKLPAGDVTVVTRNLGTCPHNITTDGFYLWTANFDSISRVHPGTGDVQTITAGFSEPAGICYDGNHIWVADAGDNRLKQLNSDGSIALSVTLDGAGGQPVYDGRNIWVPSGYAGFEEVAVVRASTGTVIATLDGNGLSLPDCAAFDGERILVANHGNYSVSLWSATDLLPLGNVPTGPNTEPYAVCSDGINFWIVLHGTNQLLRF
jgi:hypothetical protein